MSGFDLPDTPNPPFLYMNGEGWEDLPQKLEDPFFRQLHQQNLEAVQRLAAEGSADANRRHLKNRLERATVAWYTTREPRYLQMATEALRLSCRQDEQWRVTDERIQMIRAANLATGELLYNVAFGYDALYPYLDEDLRQACLAAIVEKGLHAYLEGVRLQDWWVRCNFNWNSALHGNAGLAAMVIRPHAPELSDQVLRQALRGLPHMIAAFPPDGGWIEGVMYFCTAVGHLTDFLVPYHRLTGRDLGLLANRAFHDSITWAFYMEGGDGKTYNFSDVSERFGPVALPHLFWWARMLDRPDWTQRLEHNAHRRPARSGLFRDVAAFWFREPFPERTSFRLERLRHFRGIDWLTWRGNRTWLAFRSGYNGGNHDNDDLGHFVLGIDETRFLCDPGYGDCKASEHNCITVRGFEQTDCATARISRLQEMENGFYLCCDIQEAFPHATIYYDRHLLLVDDAHLLLVDDVLGRDPVRVTVRSHLQTRLPFPKTDEGWRIEGERNVLRVIHLADAGYFRTHQWHPAKEPKRTIGSLSWKSSYDRVHTVQVALLTFADPDYTYAADDNGLSVSIDGTSWRFTRGETGRLRLQRP